VVALPWLALLACGGADDTGTAVPDDTGPVPDDSGDSGDTQDTVDADSDGWTPPEDCDDTSPYTHPGAEEWCDPVDHDCDGEPLEEGVCAKTQMIEAIEAPWIDGDWYRDEIGKAVFVGDLDGEPGEELVVDTWHSFDDGMSAYGAIAIVSRFPEEPGTSITELADHVFAQSWGPQHEFQGVGDFNGDGIGDLMFIESGGVIGILALCLGPSSTWSALTSTYYVASVIWEDPDPDETESFGNFVDGVGDVNGDGFSEILVEANNDDYQNVLILGQEETPAGGDTLLEQTLNTPRDGRDYGLGPDLDGDGLDDILGISASGYYVLLGANLPLGEATVWEDLASWVHRDFDGGDNCQLVYDDDDQLLFTGDWTGDGISEIGLHCDEDLGTDSGEDPTLYLVDGAGLAASEAGPNLMDVAYGPWLMLPDALDKGGTALPLSDIDGDGQDDLWFTGCGRRDDATGCRYYLLRSTDGLPGPYTNPKDDGYSLSLTEEFVTADSYAYITGSGDLDGDSHPELALKLGYDIVTDPAWAQTSVRLVQGWDLPWDDPFYW